MSRFNIELYLSDKAIDKLKILTIENQLCVSGLVNEFIDSLIDDSNSSEDVLPLTSKIAKQWISLYGDEKEKYIGTLARFLWQRGYSIDEFYRVHKLLENKEIIKDEVTFNSKKQYDEAMTLYLKKYSNGKDEFIDEIEFCKTWLSEFSKSKLL